MSAQVSVLEREKEHEERKDRTVSRKQSLEKVTTFIFP